MRLLVDLDSELTGKASLDLIMQVIVVATNPLLVVLELRPKSFPACCTGLSIASGAPTRVSLLMASRKLYMDALAAGKECMYP